MNSGRKKGGAGNNAAAASNKVNDNNLNEPLINKNDLSDSNLLMSQVNLEEKYSGERPPLETTKILGQGLDDQSSLDLSRISNNQQHQPTHFTTPLQQQFLQDPSIDMRSHHTLQLTFDNFNIDQGANLLGQTVQSEFIMGQENNNRSYQAPPTGEFMEQQQMRDQHMDQPSLSLDQSSMQQQPVQQQIPPIHPQLPIKFNFATSAPPQQQQEKEYLVNPSKFKQQPGARGDSVDNEDTLLINRPLTTYEPAIPKFAQQPMQRQGGLLFGQDPREELKDPKDANATLQRRTRHQLDNPSDEEELMYNEGAFRQQMAQQHKNRPQLDPNGLMRVKKSELKSVMKSKQDIYNILTKEGQMYLPPYAECSMQFINDIMMSKKKVFKNEHIKLIDVPYFDELSANKIFEKIRTNAKFQEYLPDLDAGSRPLNRKYLFNVINTIDPKFFIANIRNGYDERKSRHADKSDKPITMAQEMYNLIMSSSQIVHNRGRALAYLGNADKKRKQPGEDGGKASRAKHQYALAVEEFDSMQRGFGGNPFIRQGGLGPRYDDPPPTFTTTAAFPGQVTKRRPTTEILDQAHASAASKPLQ